MKQSEILRGLAKFPQKKLGQNFLQDERVLGDICEAAALSKDDTVVEIGPGLGVLTRELSQRAGRVLAIELDRDLAEYVRSLSLPNVTVVTGNALDIDWTITLEDEYKVVANIPYSITSPLLRKIFHLPKRPNSIVLLIQKEVAERITAKPGDRNRGYLTMLTETNGVAEIIRVVKPGSFYPQPKVDSAVVRVTPHENSSEAELFWPPVEAAFRHPRQTAVNGIANTLHLPKGTVERIFEEHGLDRLVRPAVLTLEQWKNVAKSIQNELKKD